jgi:hypothetical protein
VTENGDEGFSVTITSSRLSSISQSSSWKESPGAAMEKFVEFEVFGVYFSCGMSPSFESFIHDFRESDHGIPHEAQTKELRVQLAQRARRSSSR